MTPLSRHFNVEEFSKDAPVPEDCLPILTKLCVEILEPVREQFLSALLVTSGYRPAAINDSPMVHGQPDSQHIYTPDHAAADFLVCNEKINTREVFDWMRMSKTLPYHQLVLEHGKLSTIIHVSVDRLKPGVRSVLEGATHNSVPYLAVACVPYQPTQAVELNLQGDA